MRAASSTAQMVAGMRAGEALRPAPQRLYTDPYAVAFVQQPLLRALQRVPPLARGALTAVDHLFPGFTSEVLLRARYFDEVLAGAARDGVRQLVVLGAGYDSTSLRLPRGSGVVAYELDAPETQRRKRELLQRVADADALERVRFVPCDFAVDSLRERLLESGFDPAAPAVVSWLGVTMYLPPDAVDDTLAQIRELAPGGRLVVDYLHRSVLDGTATDPGARRGRRLVEARGEPYHFGLHPSEVEGFMAARGFAVEEHLQGDDLARRYPPADGGGRRPATFLGLVNAVAR